MTLRGLANGDDPAMVIVSLLTAACVLAAVYLAVLVALNAALRPRVDAQHLAWLDRLGPAMLKRWFNPSSAAVVAIAGFGVAAMATPTGASDQPTVELQAATSSAAPGVAVMRQVDSPADGETTTPEPSSAKEAVMRRVQLDAWSFDTAPPSVPEPSDEVWVVTAGDHLWSIAHDTLVEARGVQPSDAEVWVYWQDLIERNRDRLISASNPDLIYPGQVFALPAVPLSQDKEA